MQLLIEPAARLIGRLSYAWKFAVVALVLLAPMGYATTAFVAEKHGQIDFSAAERDGVAYIAPVMTLLGDVVSARSAAVAGERPPASLSASIAAVDEVESSLGEGLKTTEKWTAAKAAIQEAAEADASPAQTWLTWNEAATQVLAVIIQASDGSNLTLDPDLDTYYLMDTLVTKVPTLADNIGKAADLAVLGRSRVEGVEDNRVRLAELRFAIVGGLAAVEGNLGISVGATADEGLEGELSPGRAALTQAGTASTAGLDQVIRAGSGRGDQQAMATAAAAAIRLGGQVGPSLDELIDRRIDGFTGRERRVEIAVAVGILLAIWLFMGFYVSVIRSVRGILDALGRMAEGDLTVEVEQHTRDEVGRMTTALQETLVRMRAAVGPMVAGAQSLAAQSVELDQVSQQLSGTVEASARRAGQANLAAQEVHGNVSAVASSTREMGEAIREIARGTTEAATVAAEAVQVTQRMSTVVTSLEESSAEIAGVLKLISSLAEQTNLLALNATIEAARAGEAGRGFTVVAGEVKELALQTARATGDIGQRVEAIRSVTADVAGGMAELSAIITRIDETQATIAGAVEQQSATTAEISQGVAEAASGSSVIAGNIADVAQAATDANAGIDETRRSAGEVARVAEELRELVGMFRY